MLMKHNQCNVLAMHFIIKYQFTFIYLFIIKNFETFTKQFYTIIVIR